MKKVLVAYTNYNYLKYVKSWVLGAREVGKWGGDIVIIVPYEDKEKINENEFSNLNIKFFYPKSFGRDFYIHYYKLMIFDNYFKKWDWIFHVDLDVIFNEKINLKLSERNINIIYAKNDGLSLYQQFDMINDTSERNLPSEFSRKDFENKISFQGCFLLFNKKIIEDGYFEKLKEYYFKYAVYYGCCETFRDQTILNLVFDGKWDDLGDKYVNKIPIIEELNWDVKKLEKGYYDDYDYTGKSIIHFLRYFAPWDENNLRFYPIWKGYNDKF
tara:strand:+ start:3821 stop:4633 length:813 start_codon:yes stop_codon:yes gene_type:complete